MPILRNMFNSGSIKTIYPQVISASRATDIPAFHAEWLMYCLKNGQCEWQNPFNAKQKHIVSFAQTEAIVFWSKNPSRLLKYLDEISSYGYKFYFQFTLNNYEDESLEHGLPSLEERIKIFTDLASKYKLVWRYDPVILGDRLTIKSHLRKLEYLMKALAGSTDKLVFSFVDLYGRVSSNLRNFNSLLKAPSQEEMLEFCTELAELRAKIAPNLKLATCAETIIDLSKLNIGKNSCIDPALINEICGKEIFQKKRMLNAEKKRVQKKDQCNFFPQAESKGADENPYKKDPGQRETCQCAPSKDIGSYRLHPCGHHCVYCYAGHAKKQSNFII